MPRSISGAGRSLAIDTAKAGRDGPVRQAHQSSHDLPTTTSRRADRQAAALSRAAPAPRKTKHEPKPAPECIPTSRPRSRKAPKAKATLDGFPPSAQRDYFEWIAEAKQDATRQKRIADAIEWLNEGKRRHWKYENC